MVTATEGIERTSPATDSRRSDQFKRRVFWGHSQSYHEPNGRTDTAKHTAVSVFLVVLWINALTTQPLTRPANANDPDSAAEKESKIAPPHR